MVQILMRIFNDFIYKIGAHHVRLHLIIVEIRQIDNCQFNDSEKIVIIFSLSEQNLLKFAFGNK